MFAVSRASCFISCVGMLAAHILLINPMAAKNAAVRLKMGGATPPKTQPCVFRPLFQISVAQSLIYVVTDCWDTTVFKTG